MPGSPTPEDVLLALRRAGGDAAMGRLQRELGVHRDTVRKRLQPLIADGLVERAARGRYRLTDGTSVSSEAGNELLSVLRELGYDAHLTGFDLLAPYAHQFVFQYPHLVYAEPSAFDALAFELPNRGFVASPAGPGPKARAPDVSRVVVLRRQPNPEQYAVRGHVAPVEKAWVDALRETRRGNLDLPYMELGRILRSLIDTGADLRYLRRYARQLGYLDRVEGALGASLNDIHPETRALQAGYVAA